MRRFITALAVGAALCCGTGIASAQHSELYYQRASLFNELGTDSTNIVFFGNSLTHGCEWHELFDNPKVVNRGINGDIVQGLDERLDCVVKGHPAKIFLLIGANDVSHDITADSIATAIEHLVERIQTETPTTKLYLQSLLPINNSFGRYRRLDGKEQVIRDINARLQPMAERRGVQWINLNSAFCDADGNLRADLTNDGLHLLAPGYLIWKEILLPYVNE